MAGDSLGITGFQVPPLGFEPRTLCIASKASLSGQPATAKVSQYAPQRGERQGAYNEAHWTSSADSTPIRWESGA